MAKAKAKKKKKNSAKRNNWMGYVGLGLLLLAIVGSGYWMFSNRYAIRGIDVSRYQGDIDWNKVKTDGIRFAFIKATEGAALVDPKFKTNWAGAKAAHIPAGAYHFFRPSVSGKLQAELFLKNYQSAKGDLPPVLDMEDTDGQSAATIQKEGLIWLEAVEKGTGMRPMVYTLPHYASSYLNDQFSNYKLWVVDLNLLGAAKCKGWKGWTFWQYKHTGSVEGIQGDVDLNYFYGSEFDFQGLRKR